MNKLQWNFDENTKIFIHKITSGIIICEMVAILSMQRWVKWLIHDSHKDSSPTYGQSGGMPPNPPEPNCADAFFFNWALRKMF